MAKYCTKCGGDLDEKGNCPNCAAEPKGASSIISTLLMKMGIGETAEETVNMFEREKKIVPDIIACNEAEIPIKQYQIARMRSRILGKHAEGRLQVTNKRLIFRATGPSYSGKVIIHNEFSAHEIAGIEIKKSNRLSPLNLFISIFVTLAVASVFQAIFGAINEASTILGIILGYSFTLGAVAPFFLIKRKFWLKLCCLSSAMGALVGLTDFSSKAFDVAFGQSMFEVTDAISVVVFIIWIFAVILVSLVPDLRLQIKTKGAADAVQIRRKIWGGLFKQPEENSGFSEILPAKDTDCAISELGALIDDLQTSGDFAIEKWKE